MEQPKQYTPEEIAQLEKSRTISDAELLKGGAEYAVNEKGEKRLEVSKKQLSRLEFSKEAQDLSLNRLYKMIDEKEIISGDRIIIKHYINDEGNKMEYSDKGIYVNVGVSDSPIAEKVEGMTLHNREWVHPFPGLYGRACIQFDDIYGNKKREISEENILSIERVAE